MKNRRNQKSKLRLESLEARNLMSATPATSPPPILTPLSAYSIDGAGNNQTNSTWGSVGADLLRIAPAAYGDGISTPAGANRPDARTVSNAVSTHVAGDVKNDRGMTALVYAWGQFIDHDIDLTSGGKPSTAFNIQVPKGDPSFDPFNTGTQVIPLSRSEFDPATGASTANPRQQLSDITAWLDGSMVYGSDTVRAAALRTHVGGLMATSAGNLLPLNTAGLANANDAHVEANNQLFLAGDVRANENVELTSLQTVFVREHNRVAAQIAQQNPTLTDEQIYQQARAWVIAEIQSITYNEFLPALLGPGAPGAYAGYQPNVNPGIANEFSTAAFRMGHSMVGSDVEFLDNQGLPVRAPLSFSQVFFTPQVVKDTGVDPILKYLANDLSEQTDLQVVDPLRNFLFGPPGSGGMDLAALNIQRGRDHGLADYNATRAAYGLPKVQSFADITSKVQTQQELQQLYGNVNNIDLWVGGLAEDHLAGGSLGATFTKIIADQFERLRDADRFWFERTFSGQQLDRLEKTTLADVIERNTSLTSLQNNVFFDPSTVYYKADGHANDIAVVVGKTSIDIVDREHGNLLQTQPVTGVSQVIIVGLDRVAMHVTVDLTQALQTLAGGITIQGGSARGNTLTVRGTPLADSFAVSGPSVTLNGQAIKYTGIDRLELQLDSRFDQVSVLARSTALLALLDEALSPPTAQPAPPPQRQPAPMPAPISTKPLPPPPSTRPAPMSQTPAQPLPSRPLGPGGLLGPRPMM